MDKMNDIVDLTMDDDDYNEQILLAAKLESLKPAEGKMEIVDLTDSPLVPNVMNSDHVEPTNLIQHYFSPQKKVCRSPIP